MKYGLLLATALVFALPSCSMRKQRKNNSSARKTKRMNDHEQQMEEAMNMENMDLMEDMQE